MDIDFGEKFRFETSETANGRSAEFVVFNDGSALVQVFEYGLKYTHFVIDEADLNQMARLILGIDADAMSGEERAEAILEWEAAKANAVLVEDVDEHSDSNL